MITLPDSRGNLVSLSNIKTKYTVLYFYPKDLTPGCTQEAFEFTTLKEEFTKASATIIGVSKDSPKRHLKFIEKENIDFTLLSDEECKLCNEFGVWIEKSMYGRKYMGIDRSTFIINKNGDILHEWRKVKVKGHVDDVLEKLKEISK